MSFLAKTGIVKVLFPVILTESVLALILTLPSLP
ncbi:hypothetical protein EELLY_v1c07980 [Entomoplasma ellychniae]|uniref:Uncharacterized protein n=1 Tax=Entomoplasma ellychniae TaxID=2114 RepID=A0A8E2QV93_9MOLU|nr:hypothetical protein EELLY_v1c07980 [Entomoplasma ellychniae]